LDLEVSDNQRDRWTFVAICPDSSFVQTVHHGKRTLESATEFVGKVEANSDGNAPLFCSDDWFYEKALLAHYGEEFRPPYGGRGRYPQFQKLRLAMCK
jgi:hypothetical protein